MISNDFTQKNPNLFECKKCDFCSSNKKDYSRHLNTIKHKSMENQLKSIKKPIKTHYECSCGKVYKDNSGLWRHKKICDIGKVQNENYVSEVTPEMIMNILKQNNDLQNTLMIQNNTILELSKHNSITNISNSNNNSNNKTFNLQFFLNETCKDAMNIMDFVDSIKLQLSDLENVGKLGYVDGISNIIVKNLNNLDITQRPVHCTDKKREVLYVKDENKWEKEDENKIKIYKVIKKVALKNQRMIPKFKEEHPDCGKSTSKFSDQYNKIIMEAMGGLGDNDKEKEERIVKNISKQVTLDKEDLL